MPVASTDTGASLNIVVLAGGTLTCETSLRSHPSDDPELGRLVATERVAPPGAEPYSPLRRRWFAKAGHGKAGHGKAGHGKSGRGEAGAVPETGLAGAHLALSPEWVRDPRLPGAVRAELATHLAGIAVDWEAEARLVGFTGTGAILALSLPRHLATGSHPNAAFLVGAPGRALTLEGVIPLNAASTLAYATARADLPGAPAALTFAGLDARPATILFLHDDLVGRITIAAEAPPWEEHRP